MEVKGEKKNIYLVKEILRSLKVGGNEMSLEMKKRAHKAYDF